MGTPDIAAERLGVREKGGIGDCPRRDGRQPFTGFALPAHQPSRHLQNGQAFIVDANFRSKHRRINDAESPRQGGMRSRGRGVAHALQDLQAARRIAEAVANLHEDRRQTIPGWPAAVGVGRIEDDDSPGRAAVANGAAANALEEGDRAVDIGD
jgi:hypothetical protein